MELPTSCRAIQRRKRFLRGVQLGSTRSSDCFSQMTAKRRSAVVRSRKAKLSAVNDRFGRHQTLVKNLSMTAMRTERSIQQARPTTASGLVAWLRTRQFESAANRPKSLSVCHLNHQSRPAWRSAPIHRPDVPSGSHVVGIDASASCSVKSGRRFR